MRLTLLPDQPPEPPTIAALYRRVVDLPHDLGEFARAMLDAPGVTAAELLAEADRIDKVAKACGEPDVRGILSREARDWSALASILRDAAPRFPSPPRVPLSAEEADASIRRRAGIIGGTG